MGHSRKNGDALALSAGEAAPPASWYPYQEGTPRGAEFGGFARLNAGPSYCRNNLFLLQPAIAAKPVPSKIRVPGSGTGVAKTIPSVPSAKAALNAICPWLFSEGRPIAASDFPAMVSPVAALNPVCVKMPLSFEFEILPMKATVPASFIVGKSKVKYSRDILRSGQILVETITLYNPIKIFMLVSALISFLGIVVLLIPIFSNLLNSSLGIMGFMILQGIALFTFSLGLIGFLLKKRILSEKMEY